MSLDRLLPELVSRAVTATPVNAHVIYSWSIWSSSVQPVQLHEGGDITWTSLTLGSPSPVVPVATALAAPCCRSAFMSVAGLGLQDQQHPEVSIGHPGLHRRLDLSVALPDQ
jgi:hypothetical protein